MTLALIAGQGGLPRAVAATLDERDWQAFHLAGFESDLPASTAFRIERLGSFVDDLATSGVTEVCLAGAIARPRLDPGAVDGRTMALVPRMMTALQAGDDAALRLVLAIFEEAGLRVVAPQDLAPDLLRVPQVGEPSEQDITDIVRARDVHRALSPLDVGQGCVVAKGQVLAVEAMPGTDWMLASLTHLPGKPEGGILFKAAKAGQDRRVDMATIGPRTAEAVAAAGLNGIAVVQGDVLVLEPEALRARLEQAGLFLTALPAE